MTDAKTPAEHAEQAADAINALNHATLSPSYEGGGWWWPSDTYDVIGRLDRMAGGLPQALEQVGMLLAGLDEHGHVGSDHGDAPARLEATMAALGDARRAALQLQRALARAHSATSALTYKEAADAPRDPVELEERIAQDHDDFVADRHADIDAEAFELGDHHGDQD